MQNVKIQKRDGSSEEYSYDKLLASITRAGVPLNEAEPLAKNIESWILEKVKMGLVSSVEIRDKVFETLKENFPAEADAYQTYKKD